MSPCRFSARIVFREEIDEKRAELKAHVDLETKKKHNEDIDRHFRTKTYKLSLVANLANGDEFFRLVMQVPWDMPKMHVVSEEKLILVASSKISVGRKANLMKLMINPSQLARSAVSMPRDKYRFRSWIDLETFWIQLEEVACPQIISVEEQVNYVTLPTTFTVFLRSWKSRYFSLIFTVISGKIRHTYTPEKQPKLAHAAKRLVFRWLFDCVAQKQLIAMPSTGLVLMGEKELPLVARFSPRTIPRRGNRIEEAARYHTVRFRSRSSG